MCNEAENVEPLAREIHAALQGRDYEMIFIDDGSTDETAVILFRLKLELPSLRLLRHSFRSGQSAAVASGVRAARAPWVATLDGDGQNDPADIPKLIAARDDPANRGVQLFMGNRKASRKDTAWRRLQSGIANGVRSSLLGDRTPDTGCGIKLFSREVVHGAAALRSHAPVPAGAVHAPRGARDFGAGGSSAAHARHLKIRNAQSPVGWHHRHLRRHVAAPPVQAGSAGARRLKRNGLMMRDVIGNLFGVVVTPWKLIGFLGASMFAARWLVQAWATRRAGRPTIPRSFWIMSLAGSAMVTSYFIWGKNDAVGILTNVLPASVAFYNLVLDIKTGGTSRNA